MDKRLFHVILAVFLISASVCIVRYTTYDVHKALPIHRAFKSMSTAIANETRFSDCGKMCTYYYDKNETGKLYPFLRKNVQCLNMIYRMAYSPNKVIKPPPRNTPTELLANYSQDGSCQIVNFPEYLDNSKNSGALNYSRHQFDDFLRRDNVSIINSYGDKNVLKPALLKYADGIQNMHVAVLGTEIPWAEAVLVNMGVKKVTTIEYRELSIDHPRVETVTPAKLAEDLLSGKHKPYDSAFSYSSVEHSGLGRYGDPINPFGDLEATAQIWCLIKPGGYFFLTVPVSGGRKTCRIEWNAHRIYGDVRLQHLTANWHVLEEFPTRDVQGQALYVLRKPKST